MDVASLHKSVFIVMATKGRPIWLQKLQLNETCRKRKSSDPGLIVRIRFIPGWCSGDKLFNDSSV